MKVGSVIKNKYGLFVATEVKNGKVVASETIDNYICDNAVVIDIHMEHKTIREIIEERKALYLSCYEIIEE